MARNNTVLILLLLCCVCSSSMSSGWPSIISSLTAMGVAATKDDRKKQEKSGEGKVCLGNRADRDYQSSCKRKIRFNDLLLGLQGSCNEGDTMIAYDGSNCADGLRRAYCKYGREGTNWEYIENDKCKLPLGKKTECKVTLYKDTNFEGDYMELDRTVKILRAPYDFDNKTSSVKAEGKCGKVILHKDGALGGTVHDVLAASPEENADLDDFDNETTSVTITAP